MREKFLFRVTALVLSLSMVLGIFTILPSVSAAEADTVADTIQYSGDSWMANLSDTTETGEDVKLRQLTLISTHDSGTFNIQYTEEDYNTFCSAMNQKIIDGINEKLGTPGKVVSWVVSRLMGGIEKYASNIVRSLASSIQAEGGRCQYYSIEEQLNIGVRGFDIRYRYDDGKFTVWHGKRDESSIGSLTNCRCYDTDGTRLTVEKVLSTISNFLQEHPTEFVFVGFSNEGGEEGDNVNAALNELKEKYGVISGVDVNGDEVTLKKCRGNIYEKHDCYFKDAQTPSDGSGGSCGSKSSVDEKVKGLEYVFTHAPSVDEVTQIQTVGTNIQVKIWKVADEYEECSFPVDIQWGGWKFWKTTLKVNLENAFKTPLAQVSEVHNKVFGDNGIVNTLKADKAYGYIRLDFATSHICEKIVNLNKYLITPFAEGNVCADNTNSGVLYDENDNAARIASIDALGDELLAQSEEQLRDDLYVEFSELDNGDVIFKSEIGEVDYIINFGSNSDITDEIEVDNVLDRVYSVNVRKADDIDAFAPYDESTAIKLSFREMQGDRTLAGIAENTISAMRESGWSLCKDGAWQYFIDRDVQTGWVKDNNKWYFLKNDGVMKTGWVEDDKDWYYLEDNGAMQIGWVYNNSNWYYLSGSGAMQTGWILDNGSWYCLAQDGSMYANCVTPDGYTVNASGAWVA